MKTNKNKTMTYEDRILLEEEIVPLSILKSPVTTAPIVLDKNEELEKEIERLSTPNGKVAIYSSRNFSWAQVGKVYKGYNIVPKEKAPLWLTRKEVRLATPEEVAKEFNK